MVDKKKTYGDGEEEEEDDMDELAEEVAKEERTVLEKDIAVNELLAKSELQTTARPAGELKAPVARGAIASKSTSEVEEAVNKILEEATGLVPKDAAEQKLRILRRYRSEIEQKKNEVCREKLSRLFEALADAVAMHIDSSHGSQSTDALVRTMFRNIIRDFVKAELLPSNAFTNVGELTDLIKAYMEKNMTTEGLSKTRILVGIGRNHTRYYDVADMVFGQLESDGYCKRTGRRYYRAR